METAAPLFVLNDLSVLELGGGIASAMAARWLGGYGAKVTRFEPTDFLRAADLTPNERVAYLPGVDVVRGPAADIATFTSQVQMIVSDRQPWELKALGMDFERLCADRPELIVVSVTPFGLTGPYANIPSTPATTFAAGGIMSLTGDSERSPLVTGGDQSYALGAANAFAAATIAWFGLQSNGRGDLVDISMQECAAGMLEYYGPETSYTGSDGRIRLGNHTRATWGVYPCLDGWAGVFALARQLPGLFALMDDPELNEERFQNPLQRILPENEDELTAKLYVFFSGYTMAELRELSLSSRVPFGVIMTPADVLASVTPADRGFWDPISTSADESVRVPGRPFPGFPWKASRHVGIADPADANATTEIAAYAKTPAASPEPKLPLTGLRVLDLTMMWAGPFCTLRLAEMGADVIKVESPSAWDNIRTLINQPGIEDPWNSAFYFNAYNRDKRSLTLDLAQEAGRRVLLQLVEHCDVVVENYRADVLDNLGLGYETLRKHRPDVILISMAAFGKVGADSSFVGFGPVIEMLSGLCSLTGYGDGEPFKTGISYGDPVAGTFAAAAIGLALRNRQQTGNGIHIDLAQRETSAVLIGEAFVAAHQQSVPVHRGNRHERFAPQGCYRKTGEDNWMMLSIRTDEEWQRLAEIIGRSDLSALTVSQRHERHDEIDAAVDAWLRQFPVEADPASVLAQGGIPAMDVLTTRTLLDNEHLVERSYWHETPHPKMHSYRQQGVPWRFAESQPKPRRHSPIFGEHNGEILRGLLGLTDSQIADLEARNVIADAPINPSVG